MFPARACSAFSPPPSPDYSEAKGAVSTPIEGRVLTLPVGFRQLPPPLFLFQVQDRDLENLY